ncbi:MAG TPA: lactate racemase domain-containing protein [Vicinamibacterales bacterium]|nr:lactate racemase domain-containing protein [Vicinamibacterales bacterium]
MMLPRQMLLGQRLADRALADPAAEVAARLSVLDGEDWKGRVVAVGLGSRGIDRIALVAETVIEWLRARGARPFVMPAMGSHGGGTAAGQTGLLASYGITEARLGVPIRADMETEQVGATDSGVPVYLSRVALAADAVLLVNRVKPHTDFSSATVGSGLRKMCAIGLGKVQGAAASHLAASRIGHERVIVEVARVVVARLPRLYGVALVEDGTHRLAHVAVLHGRAFEAEEPALFDLAWQWMPALPFREVDVLIVDEIGKDISGAGMDTNIIGRGVDLMPMANRRSIVRAIYARGLTPASHGNAVGIGLADIVSSRLVAQMDPAISYTNALSAMTPATVRVSIHFPTDRECLQAALRVAGVTPEAARILRIRSTLHLAQVVASEAYAPSLDGREDLTVLVPPSPWSFDSEGNFDAATDLLAAAPAA